MKKLIVIAGPTASGKSDYGLKLAKESNGVIINADSVQIYNNLNLLTARPQPNELDTAHHKLYGTVDARKADLNVDDWAHLATDEIKSAWENDQTPILVGGTGFYIKSLLEGLSPIPSFESSKKILKGAALQKAYKYLESIDPVIGVKIQPNDAQRVQRAVEVYENTGKPLSYWQSIPKESLLETLDFEYKVDRILILPKRDANVEKADLRFNKMLELGVVDEVEQFMYQNIPITHTIYKAIGLNEIIEYIKGYLSKNEMIEKAVTKTAQYIKRQTTWFKHQYNADQVIE